MKIEEEGDEKWQRFVNNGSLTISMSLTASNFQFVVILTEIPKDQTAFEIMCKQTITRNDTIFFF